MKSLSGKKINVVQPTSMYKWAKNFKRIQDRFFKLPVKPRRQKQIEDFIILNNFKKVFHLNEVLIDFDINNNIWTKNILDADLILKTDARLDRASCDGIIKKINSYTLQCNKMLWTLNRHYLNINNKPIDLELPSDYQQAITSWLSQSLPNHIVVDLSWYYLDNGKYFTWSIPDRIYYIERIKDDNIQ